MKDISRIKLYLLSGFYLMLSIGFGIKTHYCHGSISSVTYVTVSPDCVCGDDPSNMSCCKTEDQYIQFDEVSIVQKINALDFSILAAVSAPIVIEIEVEERGVVSSNYDEFIEEGPPIYLLNSSLVFYA